MFNQNNILTDYKSIENGVTPEHWLRAVQHGFDDTNHTYPSLWDKQAWRYHEIINEKEIVFRLHWDHTQKNMIFIYADACYYKPNDIIPFNMLGKAIIIHTLERITIPDENDIN